MLAERIIDKVLSKYENSKASQGEAKRKVELKIDDAFFDGLRNGSQELDIALEMLGKADFVQLSFKDDYLEKVTLKLDPESVSHAYQFAKRENPNDIREKLLILFESKAESSSRAVSSFSKHCLSILGQKRPNSILNSYGSIDDIELVIKCIEEMERLDGNVAERVFSSSVLGDSKAFASLKAKVVKVLREFADMSFDEEEDPVEYFGIVPNRTYAFIKGDAVIDIHGQMVDLREFGHEIALSDAMISDMRIVEIRAKKLYTIENLTSFYEFKDNDSIVVYLGGFHNSVRRKLIQKCFDAKPSLACYHYGDIDAGGFYIVNHLREKTGIPFATFKMDVATLQKHLPYCKKLTSNDVTRLQKMLEDFRFLEFSETISFMLKNFVKLEQEAELLSI